MRITLLISIFILGCSVAKPQLVVQSDDIAVTEIKPGVYRVKVICDLDAAEKAGDYKIIEHFSYTEPRTFTTSWRGNSYSPNKDHQHHITPNEPMFECQPGQREIILFDLGVPKETTPDSMLAQLDAAGLRPATLFELLALGSTYPELQLNRDIIALGYSWNEVCEGEENRYEPMTLKHYPSIGGGMNDEWNDMRVRTYSMAYFVPGSDAHWRPAGFPFAAAAVRK